LASERAWAVGVAIVAGIDEAGFGPLLGPLVVSCDAFSVEPAMVDADFWETFKRSVGKTRKHLAGRLLIADSKKAYHRGEGLGHLERTVLAVLRAMGVQAQDLAALLGFLCPDSLPRLAEYAWHQDLQCCRLGGLQGDARIAAGVFADDLELHGVKLAHLRSGCLDVAYYNRMVEHVKNKSHVLFITTSRLIQDLLEKFPSDDIHVLIDRQGGRAHYREHLLRSFPGMDLRIVHEDDRVSTYELRASRLLRLTFEVGGDDHYLPVSLASMVCKYVRELLMDCMNRYFVALDAGLKPTAGYWTDGRRFVAELRARLPNLPIDDHRLIRCR
jgi:ribonuclease HII